MKIKLALMLFTLFLLPIVGVGAANLNLDDLESETVIVTEGESEILELNEVEYTLKADLVQENEVRISFQPTNLALAIKKEGSSDVDINNDEDVDISIKYLSNIDKTATLAVSKPGVVVSGSEEESEDGEDEVELPNQEELTSALKQNMKFIIGGVVVLIILILIFSRKKNNPDKLYTKAENLHREGREFHEDGDEETAMELYDKAEELREKARELEKTGGM